MKQFPTKQTVIRSMWLRYYNKTLFEAGVITEQQKNKMMHKIKNGG